MRLSLFALMLPVAVHGQTPKPAPKPRRNLTDYVAGMGWNAAKSGPLVVLEPDTVRETAVGSGLAAFGRKRVAVGGLTAIVPITMVTIDDSMRQPPNLYDGLPRNAKVVYLMSTFTPAQTTLANTRGIGLGDLQGEQRAVFRSLLPNPFRWYEGRANKDGWGGMTENHGALTDDQRAGVRLKIARVVTMHLNIADGSGTYPTSTGDDYGKEGDEFAARDNDDEFHPTAAFGVQIRSEKDNRAKPTDLVYRDSTLGPPVTLSSSATVRQILARIGKATGREILADVRVADRKVVCAGTAARSGDVLQALALAVTGTYRRVGPAYVLTSDLEGMGARKLRLAYWQQGLETSVRQKEAEWQRAFGAAGGVAKVGFAADDSLAPDARLRKRLDAAGPNQSVEVTSADLTPELRGYIERHNARYSHQSPARTDKASVSWEMRYAFVLPSGQVLRPEGQLGFPSSFFPRTPPQQVVGARPTTGPTEKSAIILPVLFRTDDPAEARRIVAEAKGHGVQEVWLDTERPDALKEAIAGAKPLGVAVHLAVHPWRRQNGSTAPDLNLLGQSGVQIDRLKSDLLPENEGFPVAAETERKTEDCLAPSDPAFAARRRKLLDLAKTPGLAGMVLFETQPVGYQPQEDRSRIANYGPVEIGIQALGYTEPQRLAFLRAYGVDPIDIADGSLNVGSDLRQPFFLDDALRGMPTVYDGRDVPVDAIVQAPKKWHAFRAKLNRDATAALTEELAKVLAGRPIWVQQRARVINRPSSDWRTLIAWRSGDPLPIAAEGWANDSMANPRAVVLLPIRSAADDGILINLKRADRTKILSSFALDLTTLDGKEIAATLDRLYAKPSP